MITQISAKTIKPTHPMYFNAGSIKDEVYWCEESIGTRAITRREYNEYSRIVYGIKKKYRWRLDCGAYPR